MANWLNTLTKEFTQQTVKQSAKIQIYSFFFSEYLSIFEISSFDKEETVGKENETQGEIKFSSAWFYETSGVGPFIFVHFEIFLSYEISPQVPGELAQKW